MERNTAMTVEEFENATESLGPCELVRGEVVNMSPGGGYHSGVSAKITMLLGVYCEKARCGRVFGNEAGVVTEPIPGTVRGADVLYISYIRLAKGTIYRGFLRTPPELIVEVKSHDVSWKALKEKVSEYHKLGVDLVWLVDPEARSVRIYPNGGNEILKHDDEMIDGGVALPKFKCRIARFFED